VSLTYPGVYVQELPNPVRPIVGVPTSIAAFVGSAPQGPVDDPVQIGSWSAYERTFGSLDEDVPLSYAVYLFFLNGGATALIVRNSDPADTIASAGISADITLDASSPGAWGESLVATVDTDNLFDPKNQFNLTIRQSGQPAEYYTGVSLANIKSVLLASRLVALDPASTCATLPKPGDTPFKAPAAPAPGAEPAAAPAPAPLPLGDANAKTGVYALAKADIFNMLCLPVKPDATLDPATVLAPALEFCKERRAMLIVDPPTAWSNVTPLDFQTVTGSPALSANSANAAVYYPNLIVTAGHDVGPSGPIAGVWAATDTARGVWKAPAGTAATITGITDFVAHVDDSESGVLNPLGVNALRTLPEIGPVVWGARTTVGADQLADQWKYIPVRRTALFIEESLRRGTQWVVFEPNDEPLWASIRLNVTSFMNGLFRQGAFQGATPAEAYLVKCDKDNNPQDQIDLGIVNILVGFAPLKPAEFVIINIQQQAGQA
jgi:phage tail sheath protein FI